MPWSSSLREGPAARHRRGGWALWRVSGEAWAFVAGALSLVAMVTSVVTVPMPAGLADDPNLERVMNFGP